MCQVSLARNIYFTSIFPNLPAIDPNSLERPPPLAIPVAFTDTGYDCCCLNEHTRELSWKIGKQSHTCNSLFSRRPVWRGLVWSLALCCLGDRHRTEAHISHTPWIHKTKSKAEENFSAINNLLRHDTTRAVGRCCAGGLGTAEVTSTFFPRSTNPRYYFCLSSSSVPPTRLLVEDIGGKWHTGRLSDSATTQRSSARCEKFIPIS